MTGAWPGSEETTVLAALEHRLATDPDGQYLDVLGSPLTAVEVADAASRVASGLAALGVRPGDRVATLLDNSVEAVLIWFGTLRAGGVAVPINTAYKGDYLVHPLRDSHARVLVAADQYASRVEEAAAAVPDLAHIVVVGADQSGWTAWEELLSGQPDLPHVPARPGDVAALIYTGGTTGPSKGCALSHNYHVNLARQVNMCWRRTAEDVVWAPLPLFHFNAYATVIVGPLIAGGRAALSGRFSVSRFWPEINRVGATIAVLLGSMAYLLAHDEARSEMPGSGTDEANTSLRLIGSVPMPEALERRLQERFGVDTFSGSFGLTEASLISWQPRGTLPRPGAAGIVNSEYFDVRIFDDDDNELPRGTAGEIVVRPTRPHVMFEGYWGQPQATVDASRNWWFHTGDIGRLDAEDYLYFVDRKKDYLRRRGENISSFEVESVILKHPDVIDVAVHAVPSDVLEDDLKVTAVVRDGATLSEEELFRWCIAQLPYFAMPRYIEFRVDLPRSPLGRVLKHQLRGEGATPGSWDSVAGGATYERR
jgi:crotonobetaine/carnitine-CoA ligase